MKPKPSVVSPFEVAFTPTWRWLALLMLTGEADGFCASPKCQSALMNLIGGLQTRRETPNQLS